MINSAVSWLDISISGENRKEDEMQWQLLNTKKLKDTSNILIEVLQQL